MRHRSIVYSSLLVLVGSGLTNVGCSSSSSVDDAAHAGAAQASAGARATAGASSAGAAMGGATAVGGVAGNTSAGGSARAGGAGEAAVTGGSGVGGSGVGGSGAGGSGAGGSGAGGSSGGGAAAAGSGAAAGSAGGGAEAGNPNQIDVYLIAGQSNATGQGYVKNLAANFSIETQVQLYHSAAIISGAAPNTWIPLRHASEAADGCGDRFGPELGFGNAIHGYYPARSTAIVKHARSATNLVSEWAPGSSATDTSHFGPEFKTFVATVDGGLKALRDRGIEPVIRGMLWQQGEADADLGGSTAADYGKNLAALIRRVREQWSVQNLLFIYGYVYPKSNYGPGRDQVRLGEKNVDQDSGDALATEAAFVVTTDDLELRANDPNTCYASDLIHFGTAGQLELGQRMASKMHDELQLR